MRAIAACGLVAALSGCASTPGTAPVLDLPTCRLAKVELGCDAPSLPPPTHRGATTSARDLAQWIRLAYPDWSECRGAYSALRGAERAMRTCMGQGKE